MATGKAAGEEKTLTLKSGSLHLWKHSEYKSNCNLIIGLFSLLKKELFDVSQ